jgi:hypothetical protein
MDLKALRRLRQKLFELGRCLCKLSGVVLRQGGLKLAIEALVWGVSGCILGYRGQSAKQKTKKTKPKLRPLFHVPHLCDCLRQHNRWAE